MDEGGKGFAHEPRGAVSVPVLQQDAWKQQGEAGGCPRRTEVWGPAAEEVASGVEMAVVAATFLL